MVVIVVAAVVGGGGGMMDGRGAFIVTGSSFA